MRLIIEEIRYFINSITEACVFYTTPDSFQVMDTICFLNHLASSWPVSGLRNWSQCEYSSPASVVTDSVTVTGSAAFPFFICKLGIVLCVSLTYSISVDHSFCFHMMLIEMLRRYIVRSFDHHQKFLNNKLCHLSLLNCSCTRSVIIIQHPAEVCVRLLLSFFPSCSIYLYCCPREIKSAFLT
jgi:hypothetical protein